MRAEPGKSLPPASDRTASFNHLLIFILLFFAVWTARATVLFVIDERIASEGWRSIYSNAIKFLLWVVPAVIYLGKVDKRPALGYLKLTTSINKKGLVPAIIISALYFAATIMFETRIGGKNLSAFFAATPVEWLKVLALIFFSPISEEILFRGFVLNQLAERLPFWAANLITAALFTLIHWPHWLWRSGLQTGMLQVSAGILLLAVLLGYVVRLTNSLWPAVAVHIANNFLANFLHP